MRVILPDRPPELSAPAAAALLRILLAAHDKQTRSSDSSDEGKEPK
ncbi:hypothetical protein [Spongiactinospora rosea]|nr:hypothetical protein [Spongiactinospora rosea]